MEKRQLTILRFLLSLSDLIVLNMCLFVGSYLSNKYWGQHDMVSYLSYLLPGNALWIITTSIFRVYGEYTVYKITDINKATWRSILVYTLFFQLYVKLTLPHGFHSEFILTFLSLIILTFLISRFSYSLINHVLNINYNKRTASVLAIASIGGHWIELQRLNPLFNDHDVTFISNKKYLANTVKGSKYYNVPDANKDQKFNLVKCFFAVFTRIMILRPRVIITTGAAPGLMGIVVGRIFGAKTIWIDSIANVEQLSLSGRIALKIADRVYTQWAHLATPKVVYSGNLL